MPLWQAYENSPEFYAVADRLNNSDFTTLDERAAMLEDALWLSMEDSHRIFLLDSSSITPYVKDVSVAADLYAGVAGANLWAQTIRASARWVARSWPCQPAARALEPDRGL